MANVYVRSGAAGAGTGADWANAYTTLAAALTAKAAGDDFWVSEDHAESATGTKTLTSPGTAAAPCRIICVNHSGAVPPVSADLRTTASITTTTSSATITFAGHAYYYGIIFVAGSGATNATMNVLTGTASSWIRFDSCALQSAATLGIVVNFGTLSGSNVDQAIDLYNTTMQLPLTSAVVNLGSLKIRWWGTTSAITGATFPTTLFHPQPGRYARLIVQGVDLSALGSGKNLIDVSADAGEIDFLDCKLGASVAITTGSVPGAGGPEVRAVNCDSADTHYRYYRQTYQGTITQETTIIRTGGASDGTQGYSRKIVTTANPRFYSPMECDWFYYWLDTPGSFTAAIETVADNVTLTDAECWVEVEYLGTSGFPFGNFASDAAADPLAAGTNQPTSSETWTTTGMGTPVKQTMSKAVTTAESGWVRARLCLAKASATVYACPKIQSTSQYQYMTNDGSIINGPAAGSGSTVPRFGQHGDGPSFRGVW